MSAVAAERLRDVDARTVTLALAVFVGTAALVSTAPRFESPFASPVHRALHDLAELLRWEYFVVVLLVGVAADATRGGSLARALLVAFAVGAGLGANLVGIGVTGAMPGVPFRVAWAVAVGGVFALAVGTAGHAVGSGLARLHRRVA